MYVNNNLQNTKSKENQRTSIYFSFLLMLNECIINIKLYAGAI